MSSLGISSFYVDAGSCSHGDLGQISSNDEGGPGGGPTGGRFIKKKWNNEILWDYTIPRNFRRYKRSK